MILVMYNEEQDALRLFSCGHGCWVDMIDVYERIGFKQDQLSLVVEYGWELIGEL